MQLGLIELASAMGTFSDETVKAEATNGSFESTLQDGWMTAEVMSNYLRIMAGDMTEAEMAALGLSDASIKGFVKQAKAAEEAATKVRTFSQLVDTAAEALGSGWSETIEILLVTSRRQLNYLLESMTY